MKIITGKVTTFGFPQIVFYRAKLHQLNIAGIEKKLIWVTIVSDECGNLGGQRMFCSLQGFWRTGELFFHTNLHILYYIHRISPIHFCTRVELFDSNKVDCIVRSKFLTCQKLDPLFQIFKYLIFVSRTRKINACRKY